MEYAKHYQAIDELSDEAIVQLAISNYYQHHPDLQHYVNKQVVKRHLSVLQIDSDALAQDGVEGRPDTRRSDLLVDTLGDFIIRGLCILSIVVVSTLIVFPLRKANHWLAIRELGLLFFLMERCVKEPMKLGVHYIVIKGIIRLRQRRAINVLGSITERPFHRPIVYLRSFIDDPGGARVVGLSTEEEQIAIALDPLGPFVALGRPGEMLPQVGAARIYVKNERWREVVEEFLLKSQLAIMRIGRTQGFWWEFRRAVQIVPPERLLLLVPCDKPLYKDFCINAESIIPSGRLPPYVGGLRDTGTLGRWAHEIFFRAFPYIGRMGSLRGLIFFDPDWTPHFVKFEITFRGTLKAPAAAALIIAMQPALNRLGLHLAVPGFRWMRMMSLTLLIISIYLFLFRVILELSIIEARLMKFMGIM